MDLKAIQTYLAEHQLDGWLMVDFQGRNDIAMEMLHIHAFLTRRFCYFVPAKGEPVALVHNIEFDKFEAVEGEKIRFSGYQELEQNLARLLSDKKRIAMEYSANGRLPYIGLVDAGTIEMVRSIGCEIVASADLVANFQARLNPKQIEAHHIVAKNIIEIKEHAHDFIRQSLRHGKEINEFDVVQDILYQLSNHDMVSDHNPNCSVNANAGNPHYEPTFERKTMIKKGDLILMDLWGRHKHDDGVFADITWMAFAGTKDEIPKKYVEMFDVLIKARDRAVAFLKENIGRKTVYGADVDDACRKVIVDAGYGQYFTHRTGHSITGNIHGPGPNIDNLETEDKRKLQSGHLFSIEPGLYQSEFGMRTEINVLINEDGPEVTTLPLQTEIVALLD